MVETELQLLLPKPTTIRCGNWETIPLSSDQIEYASLDVYASTLVYESIATRWMKMSKSKGKCIYDMLRKNFIAASSSYSSLRSDKKRCRELVFEDDVNRVQDSNVIHDCGICDGTCEHFCFSTLGETTTRNNNYMEVESFHESIIKLPTDISNCGKSLINLDNYHQKVIKEHISLTLHTYLRNLPDFVPSISIPSETLSSKEVCYRLWNTDKKSMTEIASVRGIKESTVMSYLIELISKGYSFCFSNCDISQTKMDEVVVVCLVHYDVCDSIDAESSEYEQPLPRYDEFIKIYRRVFKSLLSKSFCFVEDRHVMDCEPTYWAYKAVTLYLMRTFAMTHGRDAHWLNHLQRLNNNQDDDSKTDPSNDLEDYLYV